MFSFQLWTGKKSNSKLEKLYMKCVELSVIYVCVYVKHVNWVVTLSKQRVNRKIASNRLYQIDWNRYIANQLLVFKSYDRTWIAARSYLFKLFQKQQYLIVLYMLKLEYFAPVIKKDREKIDKSTRKYNEVKRMLIWIGQELKNNKQYTNESIMDTLRNTIWQ